MELQMTPEEHAACIARIQASEEREERAQLLRSIENPAVLNLIERLEAERDGLKRDLAPVQHFAKSNYDMVLERDEQLRKAGEIIETLRAENAAFKDNLGYGRPITARDMLEYEVAAADWLVSRISWPWAQAIAAKFFAAKVNRKMASWQRVHERKKWLDRHAAAAATNQD